MNPRSRVDLAVIALAITASITATTMLAEAAAPKAAPKAATPADAPANASADKDAIANEAAAKAAAAKDASVKEAASKEDALKAEIDKLVKEATDENARAVDARETGSLRAARTAVARGREKVAAARAKLEIIVAANRGDKKGNIDAIEATLDKTNKNVVEAQRGCNGASVCLFAGVFAASYSLTTMSLSPRRGQSGHQIVSAIIPTAGVRWAFHEYISLDVSLYTALLSQELKSTTVDPKSNGCRSSNSGFDDRLPCEGNALARPYGALNFGLTFGSESLGLLSPGLSFGFARTTQDPTAQPFFGFVLGLGQVFTTIKLKG